MKVQDILKTDAILKAHPEDTLSSALRNISSAHDAVFVFDDTDELLGVVNPYYTLVKKTYTWDTKLKNCLFHPPRVYLDMPIQEIVRLMVESKLHYLPVFDKEGGSFVGITSARKLLSVLEKLSIFHITNKKFMESKENPLVVLKKTDTVAKALELFRTHHVSKLVVIDESFKLQGLFTYADLVNALMAPLEKDHQSQGEDEIMPKRNQTIEPHVSLQVVTMTEDQFLDQVLSTIIMQNLGCVVITSHDKKARGIITVRDFMNFLKEEKTEKTIELTTQHLSPEHKELLMDYLPVIQRWIDKITDLECARMIVKEERHGSLFKVSLHLIPQKGNPLVLEEENHHLEEVLRCIKKEDITVINRKETYMG